VGCAVPAGLRSAAVRLAHLLVLALSLASCAARPQLCGGAAVCGEGLDCVAGMCQAAPSPLAGSRRLVVPPADIAVLERGEGAAGGAVPSLFTLGRAGEGVLLLLRFDLRLDRSVTVLRASLLLDRSGAVLADPEPVSLHALRVISRWSPRSVSWPTAPALQDVGAPRTVVEPAGPDRVRVDVTDLARRWLAHDPGDQGVAVVAENASRTGVAFTLGSSALAPASASDAADGQPPRLELYLR
jgi:hypothetical protein